MAWRSRGAAGARPSSDNAAMGLSVESLSPIIHGTRGTSTQADASTSHRRAVDAFSQPSTASVGVQYSSALSETGAGSGVPLAMSPAAREQLDK